MNVRWWLTFIAWQWAVSTFAYVSGRLLKLL